ncbi:WD40-like repeat containing protein [Ceraceosorus bombacis]|uniref:WD40-like repeat containing protein n=1 Tax=Ceraceosorus bombacis TaxID=401625 RepID=A0A0P1BFM9_9BASI|nr:WD40-like repeat containing protein [Ceraceosorus bombacis]
MTGQGASHQRELLNSASPDIIAARVDAHHSQLRDVVQLGSDDDTVIYLSAENVCIADFSTLKPPTTLAALDFPAHSRILPASSSGAPLWRLCTPTGRSINNSIFIAPPTVLSRGSSSSEITSGRAEPIGQSGHNPLHPSQRQGQRRARSSLFSRHALDTELERDEDAAAAYGFTMHELSRRRESRTSGSRAGEEGIAPLFSARRILSDESVSAEDDDSVDEDDEEDDLEDEIENETQVSARVEGHEMQRTPNSGGAVLFVSNNDQTLRCFRLRPGAGSSSRIDTGLPGLTRVRTVSFPTAINHSSLSPDGRTLVAVGDTAEVFLYHMSTSGTFDHIKTLMASTDASFSTTWSPDGMKFAVASQDGVISIWDVRSNRCEAQLYTSQDAQIGPGAARVVKWSPRGDLLAYTEHENYFHVVETTTFKGTQRISVATPSGRPESERSPRRNAAAASPPSSNPRGDMVIGAESTTSAPLWSRGSRTSASAASNLVRSSRAGGRTELLGGGVALQTPSLRDAWEEALPIVRAYSGFGPGSSVIWPTAESRRQRVRHM